MRRAAAAKAAAMLLLRLPTFFFAVWIMYWSLPLAVLRMYIPVWRVKGPRNDTFHWCRCLVDCMRIKFRKVGTGELYSGPGPCMFLGNHRSWADFFLDCYLSGGRAQMLSRLAVLYAFPMFMLPVVMLRGCIVFKRGSIADKEAFNRWIDKHLEDSPQAGVLVYPEGHRSTKPHPLPLKRGMLYYAYSRKLPVQMILSGNKEAVVSEKEFVAGFGCTVVTSYSDVIRPAEFASVDGFLERVQQVWDSEWRAVMSADAADLEPMRANGEVGNTPYPLLLVAYQLMWTAVSVPLMIAVTFYFFKVLLVLLGKLGPLGQQVSVALLVAYCAASMAYCYTTRLPKPLLLPDGSVAGGGTAGNGKATGDGAARGGGTKRAP